MLVGVAEPGVVLNMIQDTICEFLCSSCFGCVFNHLSTSHYWSEVLRATHHLCGTPAGHIYGIIMKMSSSLGSLTEGLGKQTRDTWCAWIIVTPLWSQWDSSCLESELSWPVLHQKLTMCIVAPSVGNISSQTLHYALST